MSENNAADTRHASPDAHAGGSGRWFQSPFVPRHPFVLLLILAVLAGGAGVTVEAAFFRANYQFFLNLLAGLYGFAGTIILVIPTFKGYRDTSRSDGGEPKGSIQPFPETRPPEQGPLAPRTLHRRIVAIEAKATIPPDAIQWYVDGLWLVAGAFFLQIVTALLGWCHA
ncbi:hypothetical protein KAJ83_12195 [Marivibrio halodurans]|uniref:Uncharacterized protein n=1 Tax=Marivibrio halodurans TaxID=2039722 RepID=A0A8J7V3B2_9PROT|nr:hypothetical protein [Marivibrio halodurans]MBP5857772.1 hypothetical protein [Marivibrio halodurans]